MIWSDRDMDLLFSFTPTEENAKKLTKLLERSVSSIKTAWSFSRSTKRYNLAHWPRGGFPERLRKARRRNGWLA